MAKAPGSSDKGGTLGEIAESLGTLLGNAEKQWRAWQGPRDAVFKAVTDVRDRASALLAEMGADVARGYGQASGASGKKAGKGAKADKAGKKAGKKAKKAEKDEKKAAKKARKKAKKARAAADDVEPIE